MGRNKALLEIEGRPLWQRQLRLLRDLAPSEIFVAANAAVKLPADDVVVIPDAQPDAGPLAGLAAALHRAKMPLVLALALDLPAMTTDYLRHLLTFCSGDRGVIPRMADRFEPLAAVYPVTALSVAKSSLAAGRYSLQKFAENCIAAQLLDVKQITAAEEPCFFNLNTPEDLAAFQKS